MHCEALFRRAGGMACESLRKSGTTQECLKRLISRFDYQFNSIISVVLKGLEYCLFLFLNLPTSSLRLKYN